MFVITMTVGTLCFGIGTLGKLSRKNSKNHQQEDDDFSSINEDVDYFRQKGFRYVFYARKMDKSKGTMIQCIRFYRDAIWFEYDLLTGELLRSFYPYQDEINKIRRQNKFERSQRINRRFSRAKSPKKILKTKTKLCEKQM